MFIELDGPQHFWRPIIGTRTRAERDVLKEVGDRARHRRDSCPSGGRVERQVELGQVVGPFDAALKRAVRVIFHGCASTV